MGIFSGWFMAKAAPRAELKATHATSEVTRRLQAQLNKAPTHARREFSQCTAAEQRAMTAMRWCELFRQAAGDLGFDHPYRAAWQAMSHVWFVTGMALQEDRREEVRRAMTAESWYSLSAEDAAWMARAGSFNDEQAADQTSAALWLRLGFPEHDRPRL